MILDSITDELIGKKDYKVKLTGYSINPEPRIDLWTSLKSSNEKYSRICVISNL